MDPRIWSSAWQDRIRTFVQSHDYSNVFDFVIKNPNVPFGQLFRKLQAMVPEEDPQIAFSQFQELFYIDAANCGQLSTAFSEALVRAMRAHFSSGWNKGKNISKRVVGVLMDWPYPSTIPFPSESGDEKQWRTAQRDILDLLSERKMLDDWCPESADDPIIKETVNNYLHTHQK